MDRVYEKVLRCRESVRKKVDFTPKAGLVLGSGLGNFAEQIQVEAELAYSEIEGFPVSTVPGHEGRLIFGHLGEMPIVCMKGRVHFYEGYDMTDVVLPVRLIRLLGAEILFLTNAAGGVNPDFRAGDLMLITDQISCFVRNPLIGPNEEELGTRFPDMSAIYDRGLNDVIRTVAGEQGIALKEGVYVQLTGPSFETPAEVRMLRALGADAVGMSTAVEAVAARHAGLLVCGVSCICNQAAGLTKNPLCHEEVQEAADRAALPFTKLVKESIRRFR